MKHLWLLPVIVLTGCSGGTSDEPSNANPKVAAFFVSGHDFPPNGLPSTSYLDRPGDAGPAISNDLAQAGYDVTVRYYVDDANPVGGFGGYQQLVADLANVRSDERIVIVAHSHGGVWASSAIAALPDVTVDCYVPLDASSIGWDLHAGQNNYLPGGRDPRSNYGSGWEIQYFTTYPGYPSVPSEQTTGYDTEDVVFPNVVSTLEVRSGESPCDIGYCVTTEWFDEKWNARFNGTSDGVYGNYSDSTHAEVHSGSGKTIAVVKGFLRGCLSGS